MGQPVVNFILGRLSVLSDDELANLDFESALKDINDSLSDSERRQFKRIFTSIQSELGIRHYGVKGMRWGVRRYQNKDGSLTEAGKRRAADTNAKSSIFGTAKKYSIQTRSGENISVEPLKPPSAARKIWEALTGTRGMDMGTRGDANYTLSDSSGNKIGELSLISKSADVAYIDWITVDENHRGKGYATDIINDLITKAREYGYSRIELNALKEPRPLYERLGFTYSDRSGVNIITRISEFELRTKRMEYDLRTEITHRDCELTHYGVKGMRWGVRRARKEYADLDKAKGIYKNAKKAYNRSVNYAGGNATGLSLSRVKRAENEAAWDDVKRDKERLDRTKAEYKIQKKAVRDNAPAAAKLERGARKVAAGMAVVGGLYAYDKMYFGGAGSKAIKAGASQVKNMLMDKAFAYTVLDSSGKILRRYN